VSHVLDLLAERALGALDEATRAAVDAHLTSCAACAAEARAWDETGLALLDALPTTAPKSPLRARVLAAVEARGRLAGFAEALASIFETSLEKARALLDAIDAPEAWEPGPVPGIALMHLKGGPALAAADTGFVRFPAGMAWPLHRHVGDEIMLIVEGGIVDDAGRTWRAGDVLRMPPGSEHRFDVLADRDCVAAVVVHEGIELPPGNRLTI
jgi:predicted ChrR family anti-sigma factor